MEKSFQFRYGFDFKSEKESSYVIFLKIVEEKSKTDITPQLRTGKIYLLLDNTSLFRSLSIPYPRGCVLSHWDF